MPTDILISSDPWENRVAILEDGTLSEIYFEREERVIGSIFKGKVQNVLPGMGASFVEIGLGRNAFLYVDDINKTPLNIGDVEITQGRTGWTINEKVNRGDDVLVQIVKEPRGLKGARVSTNISLPGRYLILMPTGRYSGVSRKIESADERNRLKNVMKRIRPEGMATVVRTAAAGVSDGELIADLGVLIRMWHGILETYKRASSPALLHKDMNLVYKAARDFITPEVEHVYIDDGPETEKVRDFMRLLGPQYLDRIQHYSGTDLFHDFRVDAEIEKLLRPKVNLPSGGSIVIETTEALTVIDINSGKFTGGRNLEDTIVRTNIEAAAEIARQVRLRDIGGIIVCDFIDMNSEINRNRVISTLEGGLRRDRTRTTIQSFSPLGLLEFTRKRVGKDLSGQLRGACPTCAGLGSVMSPESVTISTFRRIRALSNGAHRPVHVGTSPEVAAQMEFWYEDELRALGDQIKAPIDVRVDYAIHPERPRLEYGDPIADGQVSIPAEIGVRVGDQHEVDLLRTRLPNLTSAAAVVNGHLIEVENAANFAGHTVKIRVIDVDGEEIIADLQAPAGVPSIAAEGRRRRRRGGRGRQKPFTSVEEQTEEQAEELRALAEEAAAGAGSRPVAIGISTAAEADLEDSSVKAAVTAEPDADSTPPAEENGDPHRRRRRRRRRRGGAAGSEAPPFAASDAGNGVTALPMPASPVDPAAAFASDDTLADDAEETEAIGETPSAEEADPRRRRRRRRRRKRGGATENGVVEGAVAAEPSGVAAGVPTSGAITPWNRADVAIAPPEPSLSAPPEDVRPTRPARRRRTGAESPLRDTAPEPRALPAGREAHALTAGQAAEAPVDAEVALETEAFVAAEPVQEPEAVRPRRRARPAAAAAPVPSEAPVEMPAEPRRRGRPRKIAAEPVAGETAEPVVVPPRRRGRPPASAATSTAAVAEAAPPTTRRRRSTADAEAPPAPRPARAASGTAKKRAPAAKATTARKKTPAAAAKRSTRKKT